MKPKEMKDAIFAEREAMREATMANLRLNVRVALARKGETMASMARKLGLSRAHMAMLRPSGRRGMTINSLCLLAVGLGMENPGDLLNPEEG